MTDQGASNRGFRLAISLAALAAFVPFVRIFANGQSLYFRDLAGQFFPARRFLLDGIAKGEWRFWNPFVHEGVPVALLPFAYPPDLLQLLIPNEFWISLLLTLHIPLAAVSFALFARELGLAPVAVAAGALIYALGGFSLSTINLYVYVQALAWAPLFILAFRRAVESGGARGISLAAITLATAISTTGIEIAVQACFLAVVIAPPTSPRRFLRAAATAILALGLAAATVLPILHLAWDSERGSGFATSVVLAHSIHPVALVQVLVAGFFGDISNLTGSWWGVNFFPRGFPYILSLYLGPAAVALACAGVGTAGTLRRRLLFMTAGAAAVSLGRYAGWDTLFDLSPALRSLRYPVKAFFAVQFCVAVLASFGVNAIASGDSRLLRRLSWISLALGGAMVGTLLIPDLAPKTTTWFLDGFLPASVPSTQRDLVMRFITGDAATSGMVAIAVGLACWMARRGRLAPSRAAVAVAALVGADLIRAGAGLNASVTSDFYALSPEMTRAAASIRKSDGRAFTCDPQSSPSYWQGRRARVGHHEAFTMATMQETLAPDFNVPFGVRTALSIDRTMLAPTSRVLSPELANCREFNLIVPALRAAGVNRVLSLEPLGHPGLRLLEEVAPRRITPLIIHIYELSDALPRFNLPVTVVRDIPDEMKIELVAVEPSRLIVREPFAKGWRATVNGVDRAILRSADGHREFLLATGHNVIQMDFEPEGLRAGMSISLAAAGAFLGLLLLPSGQARKEEEAARQGKRVGPNHGGGREWLP